MGQLATNIGIDGRCLSGELTGIGHYVHELIKELDVLLPAARFFVYSPLDLAVELPSNRWIYRTDGNRNIHRILTGYMWLKFRCGKLAREDDLDVFWANRTLLPRLDARTRTVCTVHDLNHLLASKTMPVANYWAHRFWFDRDVRKAGSVITNSRGTASRLQELIGRTADSVAQPAVAEKFRPQKHSEIDRVREQYELDSPYLLAVGTQEPRKNLHSLIDAFLSLKQRGELGGYRLALAGSRGWKNRQLASRLESDRSGSIRQLGYVPDADLPGLYAGADLFVFPSLYEGFGMPVLEARACGTRVVANDIPELREAGGQDSIYTGTTSWHIAEAILTALSSKEQFANAAGRGPTWRDSAVILAETLISGG